MPISARTSSGFSFDDGSEDYVRAFDIVKADAPLLNVEPEALLGQLVIAPGEETDAQDFLGSLARRAKASLLVLDNYWSTADLGYLVAAVDPAVRLSLYVLPQRQTDAQAVALQHANTVVRVSNKVHDRYILIDGTAEVWHIGASFNHAGKKLTQINRVVVQEQVDKLKAEIEALFPGTF